MSTDGVTLIADCARDYGQRAEAIGLERRSVADLQDAKNHPSFKAEHHALLDRLAREYRASLPLLERPPRFTMKLGVYGTKEEMIASVEGSGHKFPDWAKGLIKVDKFLMLAVEEEYDFFETTVKELTGKDKVKTPELYDAMHRLGFIDAPHESACAIRGAFTDQPMDQWAAVLSVPTADTDGRLSILSVARYSNGSWVHRYNALPDDEWGGGYRLFVCRKR